MAITLSNEFLSTAVQLILAVTSLVTALNCRRPRR